MNIKPFILVNILLFCFLNSLLAQTSNDTTYTIYTKNDSSEIELKYHYISEDTLVQVVNKIHGKNIFELDFDTLIIKGLNVFRINYNKAYKFLIYEYFINDTSIISKSENYGTITFEKVVPLSLYSINKNIIYHYTLDQMDALVDLNCVMKYTFSIKDKRIIEIDDYY
jgi:hypothetical protein